MAVTSPTSASPGLSLLEWDEAAVHSWMSHLSLGQYEDLIFEHEITGDVLAAMDHASLQELGMASVGHRLNLLRAVWELKWQQGIAIGEDEWRPQDEATGGAVPAQSSSVDRLWDLILEQHERLISLERNVNGLLNALEDNGIVVPASGVLDSYTESAVPAKQNVGENGVRLRELNGRGSDGEDYEPVRLESVPLQQISQVTETKGPSRVQKRTSQLFPSSLTSSTTSNVPLTSDSSTFQDSLSPAAASAAYPFGPANTNGERNQPASKPSAIHPPPFARLISGTAILGASAASPPSASGSVPSSTPPTALQPLSSSSTRAPHSLPPSTASGSGVSPNPPAFAIRSSSTGPSDRERSRAKDAAHSAAKSFRVTLEDPCWKVLPAALKKYKINDDWKMYALFICFGNTERCLSYDEKPLMLFQKLKESGQRPVFMLRHIRDIKSPIAVAQQKQATKLGLPPNTTTKVLPKISSSDASPTKVNGKNLQPGRSGDEGQTPNGGTFPELPSPGLRDGDGLRSAGATGTVVDEEGNVTNITYAVAIYPYIADRQDEFDVAVGATFVILSKAKGKGWYIVQNDPDGLGNIVPDQSKSGWVPAGCLLEISSPISAITPKAGEYPGLSALPPSVIMSSSYPGLVLMDYEAKGGDELTLKEGEKVKVYKKYCHWSYTIKQDSGERGWVPAWFIGKVDSGSGSSTDSQPSSAATLTGPAHGSLAESANIGEGREEEAGGAG